MRALERDDPRTVGRYRILARLGAGGMAVVYFGRSPGRRAAAVKVMHADLAAEPDYRERFQREVRATRVVAGQYCPAVLDADPDAEIPWLVTEFLPSVSLRDAVRRHGPLPADAMWPLAAGIAEALASVHRAGVAHLDLKPANVLLAADGPRLIDFGIAAELGPRRTAPDANPAGSWGFMSPEQVAGAATGPASDVYSLGATLAYARTGTRHAASWLDEIADDRLRSVIADCLRPDPGSRPAAAELLEHLAPQAGQIGTRWPPAAVRADIDRRASEAKNPPVALSPPAPRQMRRRTLLLSGGVLAVAAGAAVLALRPNGSQVDESEADESELSTAAASPPVLTASPNSRTLEFYAFGRTTVKTLTTVVNGQAVTVRGVPLPYRRTVQVPPGPEPATWRLAFRCTAGLFQCVVLVDGFQVWSGGGTSTRDDITGDESGET